MCSVRNADVRDAACHVKLRTDSGTHRRRSALCLHTFPPRLQIHPPLPLVTATARPLLPLPSTLTPCPHHLPPLQITIKPQPRFGSLALSGSMLSSTAAAAAGHAFPHRSSSSASNGAGKDGAGGTGSGEAGGEENGPSHRWNVAAVPMRFNWGGDGADGDAAAAAAKAAAAAAAAVKLCGTSLPEDPPASPSAATLATARAEQALRLQHQRRARRMSAVDMPTAYQAHMAAVAAAGAGGGGGGGAGCSSDGTGLVGEDSEAPLPSRFQMHLAQLLGPEGDVGAGTDGSGAAAAVGSPRTGARRSIDAARPRMLPANAAGRQFPQFPSRGIGSAGAGEDLAPPSPSGGSAVAQRLMQARTQLQQQMTQQMQGHRHSTSGEPPGAGGALRPTPLAVPALAPGAPPAGALSPGQLGSTGTGDFASVGAAGAGAGGSGGLPTDPTAAAALARLARVTRTQAQRPEPQQIWAVDSATAAALTHGADSAFGSGYSYSVYGRGIPGLPVRGFSGDGELGGGGAGGGAGGAGALRARNSGQQAAPPLPVGGVEAPGAEEAGGAGSRGGSFCGTPAAAAAPDAVAVADPSDPGAGQQQGSAGDMSSPLLALASPTAISTPRPPRQLPTLSVPGALRSGGASPGAGGAALPSPGGAAGSPVPGFLGMRGSVHSAAGRQRRGSLSIADSATVSPSPLFGAGVNAGAGAGVMRSGSSFTPRPPQSASPAGAAAGGVSGASAPLPSALSRTGASGPGGLGVAAAVAGGRSPAAASPSRMLPPTRSVQAAGANSAAGSFSAQGMDEARHGLNSRSGAAGALPPQPGALSPSSMSSQQAPDSPSGGIRRQRFANLPPSSAPTRTDGSGDGGAGAGIGGWAGGGGDVGAGDVGTAPSGDPERAGIMVKMKKALSFLRKGAV